MHRDPSLCVLATSARGEKKELGMKIARAIQRALSRLGRLVVVVMDQCHSGIYILLIEDVRFISVMGIEGKWDAIPAGFTLHKWLMTTNKHQAH